MKNILKKISQAVQMLLLAPVKLPGKALNVIRYVALGLGILEAVVGDEEHVPDSLRDDTVNSDEQEGGRE